jgi:predicted dehydrogenase
VKRIGIVGAGNIGRWHAKRWLRLPVDLVGYYDLSSEATAAAVEEFGGNAFDSIDALVDAVDVVDVCTPTPHHKTPVLLAASSGKDIVCEKPLARHVNDAAEMVAACEATGSRLFVAQVVRFFRQFSQAKAAIDRGEIGRPGVFRSLRGGTAPQAGRSWFSDFDQSGGCVMDLGVHDIDFARWCLGDIERVFARGLAFAGTWPQDHALVVLRFRSGAIGHIESSWAYPPGGFHTSFEIAGECGLIEYDSAQLAPLTVRLASCDAPTTPNVPQLLSPLAYWDDPYYLELRHFLDCLERGHAFLVSPRDGLEAVRVALAAIESMRTGKPVVLDDHLPAHA